jgi:serine protease
VEEPARVAKLDLALTTQTVVSGRTTYIQAKADVTVVDANGKPINDAIVTGRWSGAATGTVTGTISDGAVTLFSPQVKKPKKPVTFTLTIDQIKLGDQVYELTGELKDSVIYTP